MTWIRIVTRIGVYGGIGLFIYATKLEEAGFLWLALTGVALAIAGGIEGNIWSDAERFARRRLNRR